MNDIVKESLKKYNLLLALETAGSALHSELRILWKDMTPDEQREYVEYCERIDKEHETRGA